MHSAWVQMLIASENATFAILCPSPGMHAVPKGHKYALYWGPDCGCGCRALETAQADCAQGVANCWSEACTVSSNSSLPFPKVRPGWIECVWEIKAIRQKWHIHVWRFSSSPLLHMQMLIVLNQCRGEIRRFSV